MKLRVPLNTGKLLNTCTSASFSRRAQLHEISWLQSNQRFSFPSKCIFTFYIFCIILTLMDILIFETQNVNQPTAKSHKLSGCLTQSTHPLLVHFHTMTLGPQVTNCIYKYILNGGTTCPVISETEIYSILSQLTA
jgi:hypothetical protein